MGRKAEIQSETKEFFLDLLHLAGVFMTSACRVPRDIELDRRAYERMCQSYERKAAWQAVRRLKEQKLLAIRERGDRVTLELSDLGKLEVLKLHIRCKKQKLPADEWCLVSFDVPEHARNARVAFRTFLKEIGFERVHYSLWRTRKDVVVAMIELVQRMRAGKWMKVYRAREEREMLKND